jgi:DnaJ-class molecular chaperone
MDVPGQDELYTMEVDFKDAALGGEREITLPSGKRLRVKIPAGIESGQKLRFAGQGGLGFGQGKPGDAYVEMKVRPSERFRRVGKDIEVDVPVPFTDAILGGEIEVPTLEGSVRMKIPVGVNTGTRLRLRGKGMGRPGSADRGDEYAVVQLKLPEKIDAELQEAIRSWSGRHGGPGQEERKVS